MEKGEIYLSSDEGIARTLWSRLSDELNILVERDSDTQPKQQFHQQNRQLKSEN